MAEPVCLNVCRLACLKHKNFRQNMPHFHRESQTSGLVLTLAVLKKELVVLGGNDRPVETYRRPTELSLMVCVCACIHSSAFSTSTILGEEQNGSI